MSKNKVIANKEEHKSKLTELMKKISQGSKENFVQISHLEILNAMFEVSNLHFIGIEVEVWRIWAKKLASWNPFHVISAFLSIRSLGRDRIKCDRSAETIDKNAKV